MCLGRVPLWVCARGPGTLLCTEHLSLSPLSSGVCDEPSISVSDLSGCASSAVFVAVLLCMPFPRPLHDPAAFLGRTCVNEALQQSNQELCKSVSFPRESHLRARKPAGGW